MASQARWTFQRILQLTRRLAIPVEDKLEMFDRFASIEDEFEPLEKMIDETVSDIDLQVQHEIDLARGK